jgi:hypothetical protein
MILKDFLHANIQFRGTGTIESLPGSLMSMFGVFFSKWLTTF